MGILLFIVFGLVVGLLARMVMPGDQSMGVVMTALLGIVGSFVGGFLASLVSHHDVNVFHTTGLIGSVLGAVLLLAIGGFVSNRRTLA